MGAQQSYPDLYELLANQPTARVHQIAEAWGGTARSPGELCRLMLADPEGFRETVQAQNWTGHTHSVLVDVVQDFGLPVLLYPDDHEAKLQLSRLGLIHPYPVSWGGLTTKQAQRAWTMPVEVAVLCAQVVPIYRPRLPLMLGMLPATDVQGVGEMYGLNLKSTDHAAAVVELATHMLAEQPLIEMLLDPDFQDQLFALQIVFEWHGICHRQELFSFAWGDDTVKPLMARDTQSRERWIERDLKAHGFIYTYRPPEDVSAAAEGLVASSDEGADAAETPTLLVLPEELRPLVWLVGRQLQEEATHNLVAGLGGWSPTPETGARLQLEQTDRLKALGCVLDTTEFTDRGELVAAAAALEGGGSDAMLAWRALLEIAAIADVVVNSPASKALRFGRGAPDLLDDGPEEFSKIVLSRWVQGLGPESLDAAQNVALGLAEEWRRTLLPLVRGTHLRAPALEAWWAIASGGADGGEPEANPRRPRRFRRPVPSWLSAGALASEFDMTCGCPRPTPDQETLLHELQLVEGVVTTFRCLALDLLSGLQPESPLLISELSVLLQEIAALAVHLNLAVMLLDVTGQTYIPVHPPSVTIERTSDEHFDALARELVDSLLVPAGAVVRDGEALRVLPYRCLSETPKWVDRQGRVGALASLLSVEVEDVAARSRMSGHRLRAVSMQRPETDGRFWLGRPFEDLRRAVAGRSVTAVADGFLEVS